MKTPRILVLLIMVLILSTFATIVFADSVYDEAGQGDLSGDRNTPSLFTLTLGQNRLSATSGQGDREYVTIHVPPGQQLEHLVVASYVSNDATAFVGIQAGTVFTEPNINPDPTHLLGWTHFGPGANNVGTDILDDIGVGANAAGFTPPLASGDYTLWLQQAGATTTTYALDFMVGPTVKVDTYNEATDGDLANDRQHPITRTLVTGGNVISATSVRGDLEYLHVRVPLGQQLTAMLLTAYQATDNVAFAAIQRGSTFSEPPTNTQVGHLLGYAHFGPSVEPVGADLLDNLGAGEGASGFTGPLGSGDYTFWLQQTGVATTTYAFNLVVAPVVTHTLYAEAGSGDLSGNASVPTTLTVSAGGNLLTAASVKGDIEYFTFAVPVGQQVEAIFLTAYNSADQTAFIAVQQGSTFTEPPTGTNVANLLGYSHFGPAVEPVGSNLLDNIGAGAGASGFSGALPSGVYTFWTQQTGTNAADYTLNFVISAAPPPAAQIYLPLVSR